ncbi:MAG: adenosylcobinamide-GDP ribazoletransferase [bacterium]
MIDKIIIALQFLTIIKIESGKTQLREEDLADSMIHFPLIGLLIGAMLVLENFILLYLFPRAVVDIILIISLIYLTGALHLDGLGDCFDAFYAGSDKEHILTIMKDSHLGSMGVISLICLLGLKWACLSCMIPAIKNKALLCMPVLGRWAMVFITALSPYARDTGKLGKIFADYVNRNHLMKASLIPIVLSIGLFRIWGALLILLIIALCVCVIKYLKYKLGGITGDTLGASNEVMEVISLLFIVAGQRFKN